MSCQFVLEMCIGRVVPLHLAVGHYFHKIVRMSGKICRLLTANDSDLFPKAEIFIANICVRRGNPLYYKILLITRSNDKNV